MDKKLFLITGMMRTKANWKHPVAELKAQLPDYEIIPLENKGMGIFHYLKAPLTIKENVEFLKEQYLANKGDVNIFLGFSLGGMIATMWSQLFKDEVSGLILVTSSFGGLQPFWKRLKISILPSAIMAFISKGKTRENYMYKMIAKSEQQREKLINEWVIEQNKHPVTMMNTLRQLVSGWTFNPLRYKRAHPTLVIGSLNDQLAHYHCSEQIHKFWDTDYIRHDNCGHDVLNDDPNWAATNIKKWLDENFN